MSEHILTVIGFLIVIIGIISGILVKLYLNSRKVNKSEDFNKGKMDEKIGNFTEKFNDIKKKFDDMEEDIQTGRAEHDSIQRQFADIRDRVGKLEGIVKGLLK